jgi:hypothetical protein
MWLCSMFMPSWHHFHQHVYRQLFHMKDKKAACVWKKISPCFFIQKLCWSCNLQVTVTCAGCHLQVAISCAQKKLSINMLMKLNPAYLGYLEQCSINTNDRSYLCHVTQGNQGKYCTDYHMSWSPTLLPGFFYINFASLNIGFSLNKSW